MVYISEVDGKVRTSVRRVNFVHFKTVFLANIVIEKFPIYTFKFDLKKSNIRFIINLVFRKVAENNFLE